MCLEMNATSKSQNGFVKRALIALGILAALVTAGCTSEPVPKQPNKIFDVENADLMAATLIATFRCMGPKDTAVKIVKRVGNTTTFECIELED